MIGHDNDLELATHCQQILNFPRPREGNIRGQNNNRLCPVRGEHPDAPVKCRVEATARVGNVARAGCKFDRFGCDDGHPGQTTHGGQRRQHFLKHDFSQLPPLVRPQYMT